MPFFYGKSVKLEFTIFVSHLYLFEKNNCMRKRDLIKKRDQQMVQKFYELYDLKRKRMDDVLKELSENMFYLNEDYIYSRIFYCQENSAYYNELLKHKGKSLQD